MCTGVFFTLACCLLDHSGFVYSQMLYTTTRCQAQHAYTPLPYIVYKHISTHMQSVWISQASMLNATVLTLELTLEANQSISFTGLAGQSFSRVLKKDKEMQAEYKKLTGHQAKEEFRLKWAELEVRAAERASVKTKTHSQEETCIGTYRPFRRIWEAEGQDSEGFQASDGTNPNHPQPTSIKSGGSTYCCFAMASALGMRRQENRQGVLPQP